MRLLILSHKPPYPIVDGGCLAMSRFLSDVCAIPSIQHIDYLTLSTHKHGFDVHAFEQVISSNIAFEGIPIDTRIKVIPAFFSLLTQQSYHTKRFFQENVKKVLHQKLNENHYDILVFESLYAAIYTPYIRSFFKGKILYRSHNLEYRIWEDLAKNTKNPLKSWYLNQLAITLKKEERACWNEVDVILPISKDDQLEMATQTTARISYVPSSIPKNKLVSSAIENSICFLGAFDWEPNVEAVRWFVTHIFPSLLKEFPNLSFHIAGRKSEILQSECIHPNIHFHGFVEDAQSFIAEHGIFVGSLHSGSGIKMKVLEAMSVGAPCVLTQKAAEGLTIETFIPVHFSTESFRDDLLQLLRDPELRQTRGKIGKQFVERCFSPEFVQEILMQEMESN